MKNIFLVTFILGIFAISCRGNDDELQNIDQVTQIYIDSLGQDLLNNKIPKSYLSVSMNDIYGTADIAPISVSLQKNADTVVYIDYVAGAKRRLIDSSDINNKKYQSKIALTLSKIGSNTNTVSIKDTLILNYSSTPQVFQLTSALYNNNVVFTKVQGQPNVIQINK